MLMARCMCIEGRNGLRSLNVCMTCKHSANVCVPCLASFPSDAESAARPTARQQILPQLVYTEINGRSMPLPRTTLLPPAW
jgi:hypothetical protein